MDTTTEALAAQMWAEDTRGLLFAPRWLELGEVMREEYLKIARETIARREEQ
jgi:hypothetical protein